MGTISMWIIKQIFKRKLKKIKQDNPNTSTMALLSSTTNGDIKKLKNRIKILNILISIMLFITLVTGIVGTALVFSTSHTAMAVAANAILSILDDDKKKEEEDKKDGWEWEKHDGDNAGGGGGDSSSGGLYPKDPRLKLRAQLLEMIEKSCNDVANNGYNVVQPSAILGTIMRETGSALYEELDKGNVSSLYTDIIPHNLPCAKSLAECSLYHSGISHFDGGSYSGTEDTYDAYKSLGNINAPYDNDHAIGYVQFEIPYLYSPESQGGEFNRIYGQVEPATAANSLTEAYQQATMDSDLGFIRPNIWYIPDEMYSAAFALGKAPLQWQKGDSAYDSIISSSDFMSLSQENRAFILFMYKSAIYGRGSLRSSDDKMAYELIRIAKSGAIENLDDMLMYKADEYWDENTLCPVFKNNRTWTLDIKDKWGINIDSANVSWYGVRAACGGKVGYTKMKELIDAAEKEEGAGGASSGASDGNWLDHPGSGRFGNNGSPYYVEELGVRFYSQTRENPAYGEKWYDIPLNGWSSNYNKPATLETGGCGIYTVAMVASNLLNKDITPDIVRAMIPDSMVGNCLYDTGVDYAISQLGLTYKKLTYTSSDAIEQVNAELNKGNLVIFVSERGPSPWYGGAGHFMALRGIDENGNYLSLNSAGNARNGRDPISLMGEAVTPEAWKASLSGVRNYVWVVGVNVS